MAQASPSGGEEVFGCVVALESGFGFSRMIPPYAAKAATTICAAYRSYGTIFTPQAANLLEQNGPNRIPARFLRAFHSDNSL